MSTNVNQTCPYGDIPTATPDVQRTPQVVESLDTLEKSIAAHEELCSQLESRLGGVLRSEPEAAGKAGQSEPKRTVVGVASRINDASDRLHQLANSYNSILRRLEL